MSDLHVHEDLARMITGYWSSQAIYAAAKLGIADLLKDGSRTVEELAAETDSDADALFRLLRALASLGIFTEDAPRQFKQTPMSAPLRSDVPGSQRALALMAGDAQHLAWGEILYSIKTGKSAYEHVHGKPLFKHLEEQPERAAVFDAAMTAIHGRETQCILEAYDFSQVNTLADIGGGNGSKITAILQAYPKMQGMLFDLPHVVERAKERIDEAGLSARCQLVGGSFFESVPEGADTYLMRHIIHDWDDEQSITILRNCRAAMPADGKLLLVESVIPPGNEPFAGKFLDLAMLIVPGGKERTAEEYRALYDTAGFELTRIVETSHEVSVIEGVPK